MRVCDETFVEHVTCRVPKEIHTVIILTNTDAWTHPLVTHIQIYEDYLHKIPLAKKSSQSRNVYALSSWTV